MVLNEKNGTLADMHTHSGVAAVDLGDVQLIDLSNARHVAAPVALNAYVNNACFPEEGCALAVSF